MTFEVRELAVQPTGRGTHIQIARSYTERTGSETTQSKGMSAGHTEPERTPGPVEGSLCGRADGYSPLLRRNPSKFLFRSNRFDFRRLNQLI
jgi:hypothetical protein